MKYAMCPNCGRRLCKGEPGTKVELECPKCGKPVSVIIDIGNFLNDLHALILMGASTQKAHFLTFLPMCSTRAAEDIPKGR